MVPALSFHRPEDPASIINAMVEYQAMLDATRHGLVKREVDFGLQRFCEACNKCARECPSGAITAGPKRMFNGYEI